MSYVWFCGLWGGSFRLGLSQGVLSALVCFSGHGLSGGAQVRESIALHSCGSVVQGDASERWKQFLQSFDRGCVFEASLRQSANYGTPGAGLKHYRFTAVSGEGVFGESYQSNVGSMNSAAKGYGWGELWVSGFSDVAGYWLCHPLRGLERVDLGVSLEAEEIETRSKSSIPFRARWVLGVDLLKFSTWGKYTGPTPALLRELEGSNLEEVGRVIELFSFRSTVGNEYVVGVTPAGRFAGSSVIWSVNSEGSLNPFQYSIIEYSDAAGFSPSQFRIGDGSPLAPVVEWEFSEISAKQASSSDEAAAAWLGLSEKPISDLVFAGGRRNGRVLSDGRFEWYAPTQSVAAERQLGQAIASIGTLILVAGALLSISSLLKRKPWRWRSKASHT